MVEFSGGRRATAARFSRGVIFASVLIVPAITYVSVQDFLGPEPHREIVDINAYPWSSIGKVATAGFGTAQLCTAAVIGSNYFLTSAHCLYGVHEKRFRPPASVHFFLGYTKGESRVYRVASRYVIPPTYVPFEIDAAGSDFAIVYTDDPLPADIRPLRLATAIPPLPTPVKTGGYSLERPHVMTADRHCKIREISRDEKLIVHDCVTHHGDSGGPLLSADEEGLILGVNVLGHPLLVQLQEQSKEGGMAVSAATISEFMASQPTVSIGRQKVSGFRIAP
jgi:V8-like Glu-specific endopeptidase